MAHEQLTSHSEQKLRGDPKRQQRFNVFYGVQWSAFAALVTCACYVVQSFAGWGYDLWRYNPTVFLWIGLRMLWDWSHRLATQVCRRLKLSLDGVTREILTKPAQPLSDFLPQTSVVPQARFVLRRAGVAFLIPIAATAVAFCTALRLLSHPHSLQYLFVFPYPLLMRSLFLATATATAFFTWKNVRRPELQVDDTGITTCDSLGFSSRFLPWSQIATCEIRTQRDVFGDIISRMLLIYNDHHQRLSRIQLSSGTVENNRIQFNRFVNSIALRFTGELHYPEILEETPQLELASVQRPQPPKKQTSDMTLTVEFKPDAVEVKVAWYQRLMLSVGLGVVSILFLQWSEHTEALWERLIVEGVPILFSVATLITIPLLHFNAVRLRADAQGLSCRAGFSYAMKHTPWQNTATAELIEERDENGYLIARRLVLKDYVGQVSEEANVTDLTLAQGEKLLAFIHHALMVNRANAV